jgi:lipopolysaccharide export system protein LptC
MSSHTEASAQNRRHRLSKSAGRRASIARLLGPVAILGGVGIFLFFLSQSGFFSIFMQVNQTQPEVFTPTQEVSGLETKINGFDKDGLPYELTAQRAAQVSGNAKLIDLIAPRGTFERRAGKNLDLSAKYGRYDTSTKLLYLEGDVVFAQIGNYRANMLKAELNLSDLSLISKSPVRVQMAGGTVNADHLEISENGKKTLFSGHVKANLKTDIESDLVP